MNIAMHDVKRVILDRQVECHTSMSRDIVIELENGAKVTIELFYKDDSLKLEIN